MTGDDEKRQPSTPALVLGPAVLAALASSFMFARYGTGAAVAASILGGLLGATLGPATRREREGRGLSDPVVLLGAVSAVMLFTSFLYVRLT